MTDEPEDPPDAVMTPWFQTDGAGVVVMAGLGEVPLSPEQTGWAVYEGAAEIDDWRDPGDDTVKPRPETGLPETATVEVDTIWPVADVPAGTEVRVEGELVATLTEPGLSLRFSLAEVWTVEQRPPRRWQSARWRWSMPIDLDPSLKIEARRLTARVFRRSFRLALPELPPDAAPGIPPAGPQLLRAINLYVDTLGADDDFRGIWGDSVEHQRWSTDVEDFRVRLQVTDAWLDDLFRRAMQTQITV